MVSVDGLSRCCVIWLDASFHLGIESKGDYERVVLVKVFKGQCISW